MKDNKDMLDAMAYALGTRSYIDFGNKTTNNYATSTGTDEHLVQPSTTAPTLSPSTTTSTEMYDRYIKGVRTEPAVERIIQSAPTYVIDILKSIEAWTSELYKASSKKDDPFGLVTFINKIVDNIKEGIALLEHAYYYKQPEHMCATDTADNFHRNVLSYIERSIDLWKEEETI